MSPRPASARWIGVAGGVVLVALLLYLAFVSARSTPPKLPTLAQREEERLLADLRARPQFAEQLEGLPAGDLRRAVREYAVRGMRRLDDESLVARAVLVDRMLRGLDEETCGAVVQGKLTPAQQAKAEATLGRSETSAWLELTYKAARAELEGAAAPPSSPAAVRAALRELVARIRPDDVPRLEAALGRLQDVKGSEACWAGREVYAQVASLPPPHAGVIARVLAKP